MRIFTCKFISLKVVLPFALSIITLAHAQSIVRTLAGAVGGYADGTVSKVGFSSPAGLTVDSHGNVYVADFKNNRIRMITPLGIVTTFAGDGIAGFVNGVSVNAEFSGPIGLAADIYDNIYVADQFNNCIRKITQSGVVTTFAGNGIQGKVDGQAADAEFFYPCGIAVDSSNNFYVSDQFNNCIRKIASSGLVSTFAGGIQGYQDGTGINAQFNGPIGITVDSKGNVYVAEFGNSDIRQITPEGVVITFAGAGISGYADGTGNNALFSASVSVTIDKQDNLFVTDVYNNRVRKINPSRVVTTINANATIGFVDGTVLTAEFAYPWGIVIDKNENIFISDSYNHSIRKIDALGNVITVAGNGSPGYEDGVGTNPEFSGPNGTAADSQGNIYVADLGNNRIRKINSSGVVSTIAGNGIAGFADGPGAVAKFDSPSGLALDAQNNIYVVEAQGNRVRKINTNGVVSTYAGTGIAGFTDGPAANAQFNHPNSIRVDSRGNMYVADVFNQRIRKITATGIVSTLAGNGVAGYKDGIGTSAEFNYPGGIALDSSGNIFIADHDNNRIREVSINGTVSTFAGNGLAGYFNGQGLNTEFNHPTDIAISKDGDLYVSDESGNRIRKITPAGTVSLWAGNGVVGYVDGNSATAQFNDPRGLCVDNYGNVILADFQNNRIREISTLYITIADGDWNNPLTWSGNIVPSSTSQVTIRHKVIVTTNAFCYSLKIEPSKADLIINSGVNLTVTH